MSLEEALNRNSDLLVEHNALLRQVLGAAGAKGATASTETATEPKKTRSKKGSTETTNTESSDDDTATTSTGPTYDVLKKEIAAWLGEYSKEEDKANPAGVHPEVTARKEALKKVFESDKIKIGKLPEIEGDADKIAIVHNWLHEKAMKVDKGFGVGRLAADPVASTEDEDDDMGV